jgi:hypothetical protein
MVSSTGSDVEKRETGESGLKCRELQALQMVQVAIAHVNNAND